MSDAKRAPLREDVDVVVVGAGFRLLSCLIYFCILVYILSKHNQFHE